MMSVLRPCQAGRPWLLLATAVVLAGGSAALGSATLPVSPALPHEAYVWQRAWNEPVREAISQHAAQLSGLTVLAAEISWKQGRPEVIRVPLDFAVLTHAPCAIGLALRIGPCPSGLMTNASITAFLADVASSLVAEAQYHRLALRELQIDFDCTESNLDSYRTWVEAFRRQVEPVPVIITALPCWLDQPSFKGLATASAEYVLQVHSLERPGTFDAPLTLCDPAAARQAVERAARLGVPFRVALPTYGYVTAFDANGRFAGLSSEGPDRSWPDGVRTREVRANPQELAALVQHWTTDRPAGMGGIIWYRLPVAGDRLNWRWPTLAAVMAARSPREFVRAEARGVEPGLVEIALVNAGDLDIASRFAVNVRWEKARLVAADGLGGFERVEGRPSAVQFQTGIEPCRLPAGESQVIGWLRLSEEREVQIEIERR